jgi:hypothetical protein
MPVRKFALADAPFERSPGQEGEVFVANLVDERHGGPVTIGFGRWAPDQRLEATMAVDDVSTLAGGESLRRGGEDLLLVPRNLRGPDLPPSRPFAERCGRPTTSLGRFALRGGPGETEIRALAG